MVPRISAGLCVVTHFSYTKVSYRCVLLFAGDSVEHMRRLRGSSRVVELRTTESAPRDENYVCAEHPSQSASILSK